jgi:hypothetical protein
MTYKSTPRLAQLVLYVLRVPGTAAVASAGCAVVNASHAPQQCTTGRDALF